MIDVPKCDTTVKAAARLIALPARTLLLHCMESHPFIFLIIYA